MKEEGDCLSLKGLAVTGRDLIGIGATPGPGLGALLQDLLGIVLENPVLQQPGNAAGICPDST